MPIHVDGVLLHTISGTELSWACEPNLTQSEYSQPFRHIQYNRTLSLPGHGHLGNVPLPAQRQVHVPSSLSASQRAFAACAASPSKKRNRELPCLVMWLPVVDGPALESSHGISPT